MNEDLTKEITDELNDCVSRIEFVVETVNSGADLDTVSVARHGMGLVLKDIEAKLAGLRDRITMQ